MSKLGLYADPHLTSTSSIIVGKRGEFTGRLDNLIKSFKWINNLFKDENVDAVVCLGDMTDKPDLTSEEITALSKCEVDDHYFIVGNHCRSDKSGSMNALSLFNKVIYNPGWLSEEELIYALPYNQSIVDLDSLNPKPRIILSHNDIRDYDYGGGHISKTGYSMPSIINNCSLFINGHLHNGGWLIENHIMNLGMLSGVNFSSCNGQWEPSVAIVDTETLAVKLFENPEAYKFKKVVSNTLSEVKGYLDNLKGMHYVIQFKVPARISSETRQLVDQCSRVDACRVLTMVEVNSHIERKPIQGQLEFDTSSVYCKLRNFLKTQKLKFSEKVLNDLIDNMEKREGAD